MKVGVLTYHIDTNNGATMQAYATCRALKELGCEVVMIDLEHQPKKNPSLGSIIVKPYYFVRDSRLRNFRTRFYPSFTKHYRSIEELRSSPPLFDAYCVGSDQVWNTDISGKNRLAYFLDFGGKKTKRFSYASSFGFADWPIQDKAETKRIGDLFRSYIGLSTREKTGAEIIRKQFGLDARVVCDPVILHKDYKEITGEIKQRSEVACYFLERSTDLFNSIRVVSDYLGIPLRMVSYIKPVKGYKYTYFPDVKRWIQHIGGSKFVVTDSFHGTVFALLYHKPFAVVYTRNNGLNSRLEDLLERVGLSDRIFYNLEDFQNSDAWKHSIDWGDVDNRLELYRMDSWSYLIETIKKV